MSDEMVVPPIPAAALDAARAALTAGGGRAVAAWLDPAAGPAAWAAARSAAWEQLHTGPWRTVDMRWRDAYGAACVLGARAALVGREGGGAFSALELADRALMLGGPAFHPASHALVASAEARLADETAAALAALPAAWPAPDDNAPPLPPGSLAGSPPGARVPAPPALPSLADFAGAYLPSPSRPHGAPVLLPGLASSWPALRTWASPAGLAAAVGPHRTVPVELGRHYLAEGWGQGLVRFGAFLADSMAASGGGQQQRRLAYLAQHDLLAQVPALARGVVTPDYCALPAGGNGDDGGGTGVSRDGGSGDSSEPITNVWLGPAGTVSPPHTDPHANLLVQVVGVKYVRLYAPPAGSAGLASVEEGVAAASDLPNTSRVDLATITPSPGAPGPAGLAFQDTLLRPGDALFIPRGWWHYVQALEASASVSFWWD
jgi:[histone H3]-dimethyl/trimethyl-L-lysine36 demethylase